MCALLEVTRHANIFDHVLNALGRRRRQEADADRHGEIQAHPDDADALRRDPEQPVVRRVAAPGRTGPLQEQPFEVFDVSVGKDEPDQHARDRALAVDALEENTQQDHGEQRRGRQAERESDDLGDPAGRVVAQPARDTDGGRRGNAPGQQFVFVRDLRREYALDQVVGYRRRDDEQQARRGGQRRGNAARGHERNHPVGQARDLRVGEHHDVAVDRELVAFPAIRRRPRGEVGVAVVVVLDPAVTVHILERQKPGCLPGRHPLRLRYVFQVAVGRTDVARLHGLDQVVACHRPDGRRRRVENRDEQQRVAGRDSRIPHAAHGEEANDDMRQTGRPDHQRHCDAKHVDLALGAGRVLVEPERRDDVVELVQKRRPGAGHLAAERDLRQRLAGDLDRDENGRHGIGEDQHAVLRDLRVGNPLHAAQHGVNEHDGHANQEAPLDLELEELREDDADTAHLPRNVGERDEDEADHGNDACRLRVVTLGDELGHRELAEFPEVGGEQQRQQHIAAGPAHQVDRTVVTQEGDQARHGYEGGRAHPVGGRGHPVGDRRYALAGDVEVARRMGPRPDGDADVEEKAQPDDEIGQRLEAHRCACALLVFMHVEATVQPVHAPGVEKDQHDEDVDRALLGKPETEFEAAETNAVELFDEQDAETVGADEPDQETQAHEPQVGPPVRKTIGTLHRTPGCRRSVCGRPM